MCDTWRLEILSPIVVLLIVEGVMQSGMQPKLPVLSDTNVMYITIPMSYATRSRCTQLVAQHTTGT